MYKYVIHTTKPLKHFLCILLTYVLRVLHFLSFEVSAADHSLLVYVSRVPQEMTAVVLQKWNVL